MYGALKSRLPASSYFTVKIIFSIQPDYGLKGPEIEPGGGEIFRTRPDRP
jgi:hypothetical protein